MSLTKHDQTLAYLKLKRLADSKPEQGRSIAHIAHVIYLIARCGNSRNISSTDCLISYLAYQCLSNIGIDHRFKIYQRELERVLVPGVTVDDEFDSVKTENLDWSHNATEQAKLATDLLLLVLKTGKNSLQEVVAVNDMVNFLNRHLSISRPKLYIVPNNYSSHTDSNQIMIKLSILLLVKLRNLVDSKNANNPDNITTEQDATMNLQDSIDYVLETPSPISYDAKASTYYATNSLVSLLDKFKLNLSTVSPARIDYIGTIKDEDVLTHGLRIAGEQYLLYQDVCYDFDSCMLSTVRRLSPVARNHNVSAANIIPPKSGGCYYGEGSDENDSSVQFDDGYDYALLKID